MLVRDFLRDALTLCVSAVVLGISFGVFLVVSLIIVVSALSITSDCFGLKVVPAEVTQEAPPATSEPTPVNE